MLATPHSRPWIQTLSGRRFWLDDIESNYIDVRDIAAALSKLARYTGHSRRFVSVAEHSVRVARIVPPVHRLAGLLHDASEAYLGDVSTPLKTLPEMAGYRDLESRLMRCVERRFRLARGACCHDVVRLADRQILAAEVAEVGPQPIDPGWQIWLAGVEVPQLDAIDGPLGWTPVTAEARFLEAYHAYRKR